MAASLCVVVLAACAGRHPAAFKVESFESSPCPADVSPTMSCFTVHVHNFGDASGQAACFMYQYSKQRKEPVVQGDTNKTAEVGPGDDGILLLTIEAREKPDLMPPDPDCSPGIPTDWG